MTFKYLYWTVLLLTCGYALWRGRRDEQAAAAVCLMATVATHFAISGASDVTYRSVEHGVLLVDGATLAGFVIIALTSHRFWPLWVAGLQLTTSLAHFLKAIEADLVPVAYAAAGRFWSYPILIILAVGTYRARDAARSAVSSPTSSFS